MLGVTSIDAFCFLSATQGAEWDCRNSERQPRSPNGKRVADDNFRYPLATRQPTVLKHVLLYLPTWMCVLV